MPNGDTHKTGGFENKATGVEGLKVLLGLSWAFFNSRFITKLASRGETVADRRVAR